MSRYLVNEKFTLMNTNENFLATFARLLDKYELHLEPYVSFRRICRLMGAPCRSFDRYLRSETGFGGDEIISIYREK